jgi:hypothetical protein
VTGKARGRGGRARVTNQNLNEKTENAENERKRTKKTGQNEENGNEENGSVLTFDTEFGVVESMNHVAWRNCYTLEAVNFIRWDREGPQRHALLWSEGPTLKVQRPTPNRVNDYEPLRLERIC